MADLQQTARVLRRSGEILGNALELYEGRLDYIEGLHDMLMTAREGVMESVAVIETQIPGLVTFHIEVEDEDEITVHRLVRCLDGVEHLREDHRTRASALRSLRRAAGALTDERVIIVRYPMSAPSCLLRRIFGKKLE